MATITERPSKDSTGNPTTVFQVRYRIEGHSCSSTFATRPEADQFRTLIKEIGPKAARESIDQPARVRHVGKGPTVAECVTHYCDHNSDLKPGSRARYRSWLRLYVIPDLGDIRIGDLTKDHISKWVIDLAGGTSKAKPGKKFASATIEVRLMMLRGALSAAVKRGEIKANPATGVSVSGTLPRSHVYLDRHEYDMLLKAIPDHYKPLVEFLAETGCRIGEALALTPSDVNAIKGTVRFDKTFLTMPELGHMTTTTKTAASRRTIRISPRVLGLLDLSGSLVFTNMHGNQILYDTLRQTIWDKSVARSGLTPDRQPRIHDLRHTHASRLFDAGRSPITVQKRLGHADAATTMRIYGHLASYDEDNVLASLDEWR